MKRHIYCRVSSGEQTFDRQMVGIRQYFAKNGLDIDSVSSIVTEHISGGKSYNDRKFKNLLSSCKEGDVIYASSTDRLGRNFADMIKLMAEAKEKGITIIACKQEMSLSDDNPMTKILLSIYTIMDEDERIRTSERNIDKCAWQKEQIEKYGYFIVEKGKNKGQKCTHFGREKGCDLTKAREASTKSKQEKAALFRMTNKGYLSVKRWLAEGHTTEWILNEFNEQHKSFPEDFCTMTGKPLTESTLKQWRVEIKNAVAV